MSEMFSQEIFSMTSQLVVTRNTYEISFSSPFVLLSRNFFVLVRPVDHLTQVSMPGSSIYNKDPIRDAILL